MSAKTGKSIPLQEALREWCDPALLAALLTEERSRTPAEMARYHRGCLTPSRELSDPSRDGWMAGGPNVTVLNVAWRELENDFVRRMTREEFFLSGVQISPVLTTRRQAIPGVWAGACEFHFVRDALEIHSMRYVSVEASRTPMSDDTTAGAEASHASRLLPLRTGLVELGDPDRVRAVQHAEMPFSPKILEIMNFAHLGGAAAPYVPNQRVASDHMASETRLLRAAWTALVEDFRSRVDGERIYLSGVQTHPQRHERPRAILGRWAADYKFDFRNNVIDGAGLRFISVKASDQPFALALAQDIEVPIVTPREPITDETVRQLSDDEVFTLLEDYARRVVEDEGSTLKMPVKVSFMPIIRRKMQHRFHTGEALPSLKAEANWLAVWIPTKIVSHQSPKASAIEKQLGPAYRELKKTSKADIR